MASTQTTGTRPRTTSLHRTMTSTRSSSGRPRVACSLTLRAGTARSPSSVLSPGLWIRRESTCSSEPCRTSAACLPSYLCSGQGLDRLAEPLRAAAEASPDQVYFPRWLRPGTGPPDLRRVRHVCHAVAVRTVRPRPDAGDAIRLGANRDAGWRACRHRDRCRPFAQGNWVCSQGPERSRVCRRNAPSSTSSQECQALGGYPRARHAS